MTPSNVCSLDRRRRINFTDNSRICGIETRALQNKGAAPAWNHRGPNFFLLLTFGGTVVEDAYLSVCEPPSNAVRPGQFGFAALNQNRAEPNDGVFAYKRMRIARPARAKRV